MIGKILIVDGAATNRIVFKVALGEAFYQPVLAADGETGLRLAQETLPDLILLDLALPDLSGIAVIERLRAGAGTKDIPIVALCAEDQPGLRLQALLAGADDVLEKPVDLQTLLARLRNLLRQRDGINDLAQAATNTGLLGLADAPAVFERPALVSLLSNHIGEAQVLGNVLAGVMSDNITIQTREEAFLETDSSTRRAVADVFVIEAATGAGLRLMSELRSRSGTQHSAICILRAKGGNDSPAMAYDLGADDVVDAAMPPDELAQRLRKLIQRKRRADHLRATLQDGLRLAVIDPLTGLHNRRFALPHLAAIAERAVADASLFAVMVIDLDRFKSVNDRHGHAIGDAVLVEVARRLKANLRADDLLARIGGEEFLVALPNTNFAEASAAADRLCHAIEESPIQAGFAINLQVTVSIGLAISSASAVPEPSAAIINRADRALLLAKAEGRNKVTISKSAA